MTIKLTSDRYIRWLQDIDYEDLPSVGGKNAGLGQLYQSLVPLGVKVPPGFAILVDGYRQFLKSNKLRPKMESAFAAFHRGSMSLPMLGTSLRGMISESDMPKDLIEDLNKAFDALCERCGQAVPLAVRSSATAEDLPHASFAGLHESYLNVVGKSELCRAVQRCYASLFTDRAISYRQEQNIHDLAVDLSVCVQQMVDSSAGASGVMFTLDTESGHREIVLINSSYGLGEAVVQGIVNPDEYYVFKPSLRAGKSAILKKRIGAKEVKIVTDSTTGSGTRTVSVDPKDRCRLTLTAQEVATIATWGCSIEDSFTRKLGKPTPMDIEWAKDGPTGDIFVLQARPETVQSRRDPNQLRTFHIDPEITSKATTLVSGQAVGDKIGTGPVRFIEHTSNLHELKQGEVLVAEKTDPDWEPVMKLASAIVTAKGGRTCHAAIVSRELGIPAVVGAADAAKILKTGRQVTVTCADGERGLVFEGILPFTEEAVDLTKLNPTFTNVMLNVAIPDQAFKLGLLPSDGVGLARMEFIISNSIGVHPLALLQFDNLTDTKEKRLIEQRTAGSAKKSDYFVDRLVEGVAMIAAGFYPREVIVRFSDFKSNEYAGLLGGKAFEPVEENPMLGFRGAARYYHPRYRDGFALECQAIRRVRDDMGLTNVKVMIPFCRTVDEAKKVLDEMAQHGLRRGDQGLEVYCMCEIPSNVILAEDFAAYFDGFSIGSNDLTQLVLGVDRDSEMVSSIFDERNKAVTSLIETVIEKAHSKGRKVGICGQAPSDYPEFASLLVRLGIDSISLNPDSYVKTTRLISQVEEMGQDR